MKSNQKKSNEEMLFLKLMAASIHDVSFDAQLEIANWEEIFNIAHSQNILPLIFEKASENKSFLSIPQYQ